MVALLFAAAVAGGCTLVRSPLVEPPDGGLDVGSFDAGMRDVPDGADAGPDTPIDTGMPDTGGFDVPESIDTGVDVGMLDSGILDTGVDAGIPDTGVRDTGVDAGMPDVPMGPLNCAALYGSVSPRRDCSETATTCTFYVDHPGETCRTTCELVPGATCADGSWVDTFSCTGNGVVGCDSSGGDRLCVCNRPP